MPSLKNMIFSWLIWWFEPKIPTQPLGIQFVCLPKNWLVWMSRTRSAPVAQHSKDLATKLLRQRYWSHGTSSFRQHHEDRGWPHKNLCSGLEALKKALQNGKNGRTSKNGGWFRQITQPPYFLEIKQFISRSIVRLMLFGIGVI